MKEPEKINFIDALRGYAVLAVVLVHSLNGDRDIVFHNVILLGAKGVQLFYTLSAFTLFLSFNVRRETDYATQNFFIRRFFRIAPMFYLAIVYYLIQDINVSYSDNDFRRITSWSVVSHFFLLHSLSPYWENSVVPGGWSVGVEVIFYMICPLLFALIKNLRAAITVYFITLIMGQAIYLYLLNNPLIEFTETWKLYLYTFFPTQLPVFMLGIVGYYIVKSERYVAIMALIGLYVCGAAFLILQYISNKYMNTEFELLNNMVFGTLFITLIFGLSIRSIPIISNKPVQFIGKISYSMYLTHFAVVHLIDVLGLNYLFLNVTMSFLVRFLLILSGTVIVSYFFYKTIELPFIKIGKNFTRTKEKVSLIG